MEKGEVVVKKAGGLSVLTAAIFLAGEMAGSGALKLPNALIGTGWAGVALIFIFTVVSCYCGTRLGLCANILAERYEEFRHEIRDPYPAIGFKAYGKIGRMVAIVCMIIALWGGCTVFLSLIAGMFNSVLSNIEDFKGLGYGNCVWMVIVAVLLIPVTWAGTPKDFWPMAVGALGTIVTAGVCVIIQAAMDYNNHVIDGDDNGFCDNHNITSPDDACVPNFPPPTAKGFFTAFSSIMFAFGGASTFPTIQADMKERTKFPISALMGCSTLFLIYCPLAVAGYYCYGDASTSSIVGTISHGGLRITAEICFLIHLVSAYPIVFNPGAQYFEELMNIPPNFNIKRVLFRSGVVLTLLFIAESIPDFGNILDIVGATAITTLTFICPPLFYMKLCDESDQNSAWKLRTIPLWERIFCWFVIVIGVVGGVCSTYAAIDNIVSVKFIPPCYVENDLWGGGGEDE